MHVKILYDVLYILTSILNMHNILMTTLTMPN